MKELPASQAYRFLEPGPIVLVSTSRGGRPNVMTMGFHMVIRHEPPLIGCVIGPWDYSHAILRETGECVVAIPTIDLSEAVVDIGNCSGEDVDKFERLNLRTGRAKDVAAPLLLDCIANIECRVADTALVDPYNLFLLDAIRVWVDEDREEKRTLHHRGHGVFAADGELVDHSDRMVKWKNLP